MTKPVNTVPPLPYPGGRDDNRSLAAFDQDLVKALQIYLGELARRANAGLGIDGTDVMTGPLTIRNAGGGAGDRWSGRLIKLDNFAPGVHWADRSTSAVDLYMNLDSGVFRLYSTSLEDGSDLVEIFSFDLTTKTLHLINTNGDGAELLRFATERSWAIKQRGTGGSAMLSLEALVASKQFEIRDSAGNIVATFGDLTGSDVGFNRLVHLNSGQMEFPATHAPSANANTLDDYEEGTWTPALTFGGANTGITYLSQDGSYVKIGQLVHIFFRIRLSSKGTAVGAAGISGVPFIANNDIPNGVYDTGIAAYYTGMASMASHPAGYINRGASTIVLTHAGATARANMTEANFTDATDMLMSITYRADA